jgi:hypothetical protein
MNLVSNCGDYLDIDYIVKKWLFDQNDYGLNSLLTGAFLFIKETRTLLGNYL